MNRSQIFIIESNINKNKQLTGQSSCACHLSNNKRSVIIRGRSGRGRRCFEEDEEIFITINVINYTTCYHHQCDGMWCSCKSVSLSKTLQLIGCANRLDLNEGQIRWNGRIMKGRREIDDDTRRRLRRKRRTQFDQMGMIIKWSSELGTEGRKGRRKARDLKQSGTKESILLNCRSAHFCFILLSVSSEFT